MGLFRKKEPKAEPQVEASKVKTYTEWSNTWVNLTDKMLRVELEEEQAMVGHTMIKDKGDHIQLVYNGIIIADVGKRGKAYAELQPLIDEEADSVEIYAKTGDYGDYYRLKLRFKSIVTEIP